MTERQESLWYQLQGDSFLSGIAICAATGGAGFTQLMCVPCGHVFIDGKPFTDESDHVDSGQLARDIYYHRCDIGPKPEKVVRSRGRIPQ